MLIIMKKQFGVQTILKVIYYLWTKQTFINNKVSHQNKSLITVIDLPVQLQK